MAGLVPAIHVLLAANLKTWMPGTRPGMTAESPRSPDQPLRCAARLLGDLGAGEHAGDFLAPPVGGKLAHAGRDAFSPRQRILGDQIMLLGARRDLRCV